MGRATAVDFLLNGIRDNSGEALASGKVYSYASGTTTPKDLYTDSAATTAAANPVILDGYGRTKVYGDGRYKLIIKDSDDTTIQTLDDLIFGQPSDEIYYGGQTTGAVNTYVMSTTSGLSAYAAGQVFIFRAHQTNSTTCTLNVDGLGAKTIKTTYGSGLELNTGQIRSGALIVVSYNGTDMILVSSPGNGVATWTPTLGASGSMTYTSTSVDFAKYWQTGKQGNFILRFTGTVGGTPSNTLTATLPAGIANSAAACTAYVSDNSANVGGFGYIDNSNELVSVRRYDGAAYTAGTVTCCVSGIVEFD
jgi:hypothetical protein